ncbi:PREDICTED: thyrotropin releasing hormone [Dipodomys ordii]|uniref:Pro-thyrotropin-releasing hormone n=1 Tax=Dipodomys ordii TaxID=10020 RepID=A0A1S3ENE1_DIPOR|nr:PREDICTED: thyrotropin releasing hormone [Dipodomys ordii]
MPCPPLLLVLALTLTLTSVPGGRAQPEAAQEEAALEHPGLDALQRQAERLLLLREDLHRLRGDLGELSKSLVLRRLDRLSKRQHPGKRTAAVGGGLEEAEEEAEGGPVAPHKRQHPGRRSPWLSYAVTKRQHPGRRLADPKDPKGQRSWEEEEEEGGDGEGALVPEKRQHPGKRALEGPCGPPGACRPAGLLLGLLGDLSRDQGDEEQQPQPPRWAAWVQEPLEE